MRKLFNTKGSSLALEFPKAVPGLGRQGERMFDLTGSRRIWLNRIGWFAILLLVLVFALNILLHHLLAPRTGEIVAGEEAPSSIQNWIAEHPEVDVVVAESLSLGFGPWRVEPVGYVSPVSPSPTIYVSLQYDGVVDWEYILNHEHAHVYQMEYVEATFGVETSYVNPVQSFRFLAEMYNLSGSLEEEFLWRGIVSASPVGLNGLEFAADCYAQRTTNSTHYMSYMGEQECTSKETFISYEASGIPAPGQEAVSKVTAVAQKTGGQGSDL